MWLAPKCICAHYTFNISYFGISSRVMRISYYLLGGISWHTLLDEIPIISSDGTAVFGKSKDNFTSLQYYIMHILRNAGSILGTSV